MVISLSTVHQQTMVLDASDPIIFYYSIFTSNYIRKDPIGLFFKLTTTVNFQFLERFWCCPSFRPHLIGWGNVHIPVSVTFRFICLHLLRLRCVCQFFHIVSCLLAYTRERLKRGGKRVTSTKRQGEACIPIYTSQNNSYDCVLDRWKKFICRGVLKDLDLYTLIYKRILIVTSDRFRWCYV